MLAQQGPSTASPEGAWHRVERRLLRTLLLALVGLAVLNLALDLAAFRNTQDQLVHLEGEAVALSILPQLREAMTARGEISLRPAFQKILQGQPVDGVFLREDGGQRRRIGLMRGDGQQILPWDGQDIAKELQHLFVFTNSDGHVVHLKLYLEANAAGASQWQTIALSLVQSLLLGAILIWLARRGIRYWLLPPLTRISKALATLAPAPPPTSLRNGTLADAPADGLMSSLSALLTSLEDKEALLRHGLEEARAALAMQEAELADARNEAEAALNAKRRFLTRVSHELRTPLHAVIGMAQLSQATTLTPRQRSYLEVITASANSLLRLFNDLLDIARMDAKTLSLEHRPFDLRHMLEDIADAFVESLTQKPVQFIVDLDMDMPCQVVGDSMRLRQVIANLLDNALQNTEAGYILLTVRRDRETKKHVELFLEVKDTGAGIPPEIMPHLFEAFSEPDSAPQRLEPSSENAPTSGNGLGLVVSKRLVEIMGGRIWATSSPVRSTPEATETKTGAGASVMCNVWLEKGEPYAAGGAPAFASPPSIQGARVLVVDSNTHVRYVASQLLQHLGCNVLTAASKEEAQGCLRQKPAIDCLLVEENLVSAAHPSQAAAGDIGMGVFLHTIQDSPLPAILLTIPSRAASRQSTPAGFCAMLEKPLRLRRLANILQHCLEKGASKLLPAARPQRSTSQAPAPLQGLRVLVVEDNPINQNVTNDLLEQLGALPCIAESGEVALTHFPETGNPSDGPPVHVVLMDLLMPGMDGYNTTRAIRNRPTGGGVPIFALTASAIEGVEEACRDAGMNGLLHKPATLENLELALAEYVPQHPLASNPVAPHAAASQSSMDHKHSGQGGPLATVSASHNNAEASPLSGLEGIDLQDALTRLGGNESLLLRILCNAAPVLRRDGDALRQALEERDPAHVRHFAHRMAGAAGNMSAPALRSAALDLEKLFLSAPKLSAQPNETRQPDRPHEPDPFDWEQAAARHATLRNHLDALLHTIESLDDS